MAHTRADKMSLYKESSYIMNDLVCELKAFYQFLPKETHVLFKCVCYVHRPWFISLIFDNFLTVELNIAETSSPVDSSLKITRSWSVHVCCLHLKMEFRSCARGRQWCGIIHYYWRTASIKPRLRFSRAGYAS